VSAIARKLPCAAFDGEQTVVKRGREFTQHSVAANPRHQPLDWRAGPSLTPKPLMFQFSLK
jgi:hypothetical protein